MLDVLVAQLPWHLSGLQRHSHICLVMMREGAELMCVSFRVQVIPGAHSTAATPFAAAGQRIPSRAAFDSDLGFPTDFGERYNLTEEIGSGSFGTVYAAEDNKSGESVAVKVHNFPFACLFSS